MGDPDGAPPQGYEAEVHHDFESQPSAFHKRRQSMAQPDVLDIDTFLSELWAGVAISRESDHSIQLGIAIHDGTYSMDFAVHRISLPDGADEDERAACIENHVLSELSEYRTQHLCKLLGVGVSVELDQAGPRLCSRLWSELDIVPVVFESTPLMFKDKGRNLADVDELADTLARKCISVFGPTKQPRLAISYRNEVQVDVGGQAHMATLEDYQRSVRDPTWRAVEKYVREMKERSIKVVFFSATPQGGGVALMRHALLRFLRLQGVHVEWYVPKPRPDVFRITKTNHNILQGAVPPEVRTTDEELGKIKTWIIDNAERYWLTEGGPLRSPAEGGADVIVIDDPQMPELIPIAKQCAPDRPVIYRSHIEVRDDLVQEEDSPAQHIWKFLWASIKQADVFISHPVRTFVPSDVPLKSVGWLPATTDWLDGLNKDMHDWDVKYYLHVLRQTCKAEGLPQLAYPDRGYFAQIARFDPSKGIPDVIKSYAKYRKLIKGAPRDQVQQLVICGHSSVDDPDGSLIFDQTMALIHDHFPDLADDIVVVRLGPSDQMLNAILSMATVVMQLSLREGFEVKVSEALHKGKPVIATKAGGIPLQIEDGKSGFLVARGDHDMVAKHLYDLVTDSRLYARMSKYAKHHVSDEVHTVGNALSWLYLACSVAGGKKLEPRERWINDLAREAADEPYQEGEPRLPRHLST